MGEGNGARHTAIVSAAAVKRTASHRHGTKRPTWCRHYARQGAHRTQPSYPGASPLYAPVEDPPVGPQRTRCGGNGERGACVVACGRGMTLMWRAITARWKKV